MLVTMIPIFREKKNPAISQTSALYWGAGVDEHYWRRLCPATHLVRLVMSRPEDDRRRPERTPQRTGPTGAPRAAPGPSRSRCFILPRWWLQGGRALRACLAARSGPLGRAPRASASSRPSTAVPRPPQASAKPMSLRRSATKRAHLENRGLVS